MKLILAKWTADRISAGNLPRIVRAGSHELFETALERPRGIIVLNPKGHIGIAPRMA